MWICSKTWRGSTTTQYLHDAAANEVFRAVNILSRVTELNTLEDVSSNGASPPPLLPMEEIVEG